VAFEVGIIVGSIVLLVAPSLGASRRRGALVTATLAAIAILVTTTVVLISPTAANHSHGDVADHVSSAGGAAHAHDAGGATASHHIGGESDIRYEQLPRATKREVDLVIETWARRYPTAADATRAGWSKSTPSLYGIGSHYFKDARSLLVPEPFDLLRPNILLYDGEGPDAKFAGVSYVVTGDIEGFTGPYDSWHAHPSVCSGAGGITLTEDDSPYWYSEVECTQHGGRVIPIAADKMMHLWIGPGYADAPIFAHDHPKLYDGYYPKRAA
jgi:hypothetical protein